MTGMRGTALSLALLLLAGAAPAETLFEIGRMAGIEPYRFPLPLPAGFRLSGGVALNGNNLTVNALANGTGTVTINRVTWSEGGSIAHDHIGFKDMAPYAGLGYSRTFGHGFKLSWEAGALFGASAIMPHSPLPGLPDSLALQNDYLERNGRTVAVEPVAEINLSLRF